MRGLEFGPEVRDLKRGQYVEKQPVNEADERSFLKYNLPDGQFVVAQSIKSLEQLTDDIQQLTTTSPENAAVIVIIGDEDAFFAVGIPEVDGKIEFTVDADEAQPEDWFQNNLSVRLVIATNGNPPYGVTPDTSTIELNDPRNPFATIPNTDIDIASLFPSTYPYATADF
jgi:hypothetical protein